MKVIFFLIILLILVQSGLYFEPINAQYLGPSYDEMTDEERDQFNEMKRLRLEQFNSIYEEKYPDYYFCSKILQIPFGCTLLLGGVSSYFLVLEIIVSISIVTLILKKRN